MKRIFLIPITVALFLGIGAITAVAAEFSDWSAPVNLGSVINTKYLESCVAISKNGLSLFFSSNRFNSPMNRDLYVSQRGSTDDPWESPVPLTMLNTLDWESCPALSLDEHRLYFTSPRSGGCGGQDLWVSHRQDRRDDFGWGPPVNLGCEINTALAELMPTFFEDESGKVWMYFVRGTFGGQTHIYQSEVRDDGTFGPVSAVTELNSEYTEQGAAVRRDGLEVIFLSNRPPGNSRSYGLFDFWKATRESTKDPWSQPALVTSLGNPAWAQGRIALSFDGRDLYFTSWPNSIAPDLYVARREKLAGKKE